MLETHWVGSQAKVCIYYVIVRRKRKLDSKGEKGEGRRGEEMGSKLKEIIRREIRNIQIVSTRGVMILRSHALD